MKKLISTILLFFIVQLTFYGQGVKSIVGSLAKVELSEKKLKPGGRFYNLIQFSDNHYISIWRDYYEPIFHLQIIDSTYKVIKERSVILKNTPSINWIKDKRIFRLGNKLCILVTAGNNDLSTESYYLFSYNYLTLEPAEAPFKLSDFSATSNPEFFKNRPNDYELELSTDKSKFYFGIRNSNKKAGARLNLFVFNSDLKKIYSREIPFKENEWVSVLSACFNSHNDFAYLTKREVLGDEIKVAIHAKRTLVKYFYNIAVIKNENEQEYKLEFEEKVISEVKISFSKSSEIVVSGFYSNN